MTTPWRRDAYAQLFCACTHSEQEHRVDLVTQLCTRCACLRFDAAVARYRETRYVDEPISSCPPGQHQLRGDQRTLVCTICGGSAL